MHRAREVIQKYIFLSTVTTSTSKLYPDASSIENVKNIDLNDQKGFDAALHCIEAQTFRKSISIKDRAALVIATVQI